MEFHLHFGMHRDIPVLQRAIHTFDGMIVPAHILAHQKASTAAFITSLPPATPYLIDPCTYRFQNSRDKHLNDAEELRASTSKLCAEYHDLLSGLVLTHGELSPAVLPSPEELTKGVIDFQNAAVQDGAGKSAAKKYLERYKISSLRLPRVIIPPYFRFENPADAWYDYSLACANAARDFTSDEIAPVIAAPWLAFREADLIRMLRDYESFDHVILWFDDYNENFVSAAQIVTIRKAIQRFRAQTESVEALYGGYLLLLSQHDGLSSIAHGILYTQHKSYQISGAGEGGAAERYYIPQLRQFRSLSQTDLILHRFPELMCECPVCASIMGGNPDRIVNFYDDPDLLRLHFLEVRRSEADTVPHRSLGEVAVDLRAIHASYHNVIRALPNPDAVVSGSSMQGLGFLLQWADGITAPL